MDVANLAIALGGLGLGLLTSLAAALTWHTNGTKKAYAAERDFQHIKRNYEQAQQALKSLQDDNETLQTSLIEIKALMIASSTRLEGISARLDGIVGLIHPRG